MHSDIVADSVLKSKMDGTIDFSDGLRVLLDLRSSLSDSVLLNLGRIETLDDVKHLVNYLLQNLVQL